MKVIITNLLEMSINAAVVISAVMLVRLFLRRSPKIYSYILWSIVGLRLCIPVFFESSFSIFNLFKKKEITQIVATPTTQTTEQNIFDIYGLLGCIWLCGILILVIYSILSYYRLQYSLRVSFPLYDNVYGVDELRSPFVLGFTQPKIYIPMGLDKDTENYILLHERTHLKRADHLVKLFAFVLLCIHWFNPLCWIAFILMSRDMEMSCDEKVLNSGDISCSYSMALLSFAQNKRFPSPGPLCFGEVSVKRRIKNILSWKKPALWITVISVLICSTVFVTCAADPVRGEEKQPEKTIQSAIEKTEKTDTSDTTIPDPYAGTAVKDTTTIDAMTSDTAIVDTVSSDTTARETTKDTIPQKVNGYIPPDTTESVTEAETAPLDTTFVTEDPTGYNNYFEEGGELVEGIMEIRNSTDDETQWWEYENIQELMN